jgi:hypothetical protein
MRSRRITPRIICGDRQREAQLEAKKKSTDNLEEDKLYKAIKEAAWEGSIHARATQIFQKAGDKVRACRGLPMEAQIPTLWRAPPNWGIRIAIRDDGVSTLKTQVVTSPRQILIARIHL